MTLPFDTAARAQLGEALYHYVLGRAPDLAAEAPDANAAAFARYRLLPRLLRGGAGVDIRTNLLGKLFAGPLVVGAFAADRVFHEAGLQPVADICRRLGLPLMVSEETVTPLADLAAAHDACWLQLRAAGPIDRVRTLLDRAADCGVQAIVLTALAPVHLRPGSRPGGFDISSELVRRGWSTIGSAAGVAQLAAFPQWSWHDLQMVTEHATAARLPILLKGVLHPDDAGLAMGAGCAGVIASNVGLRQLGRWALPLDQLAELRARMAGPLLLDGGIRHGVDAVIGRCLGADMAVATRPVVAALAGGGPAGVAALLQGWLDEIANVTSWLGAETLAALDGGLLTRPV